MKILLILTSVLFTFNFAQASFFPQTIAPQSVPILKCHNSMAETPESRLSINVYSATQQNPYSFVTVEKINTNAATDTLFAGGVTEKAEDNTTLLFSNGMNMRISDNTSGNLDAVVTLKKGQDVKFFTVNCETIYQLMPISQTQTM